MSVHPIERLFAASVLTPFAIGFLGLWPAEPVRIPIVILGTCGLIDGALRLLILVAGALAGSPPDTVSMENPDGP